MDITPGGARAAFEETRSELERGHEEKLEKLSSETETETRALTESETFASLKKRKATFEAATSAFNARPSVATLAAVMEISAKNVSEANAEEVDVADPGFPARAAAFLVGAGDASGDANGDANGDDGRGLAVRAECFRARVHERGVRHEL